MSVRILIGDVRERLRGMADDSVHCVVTSPPYWGLRDYGVVGQMGLEATLGEHLEAMVAVFREVRRVLRADGTCWVNYGDCYATSPNGRSAAETKAAGNDDRTFRDKPFSTVGAIYASDPRTPDRRGEHSTLEGAAPPDTPGRVCAGGTLKPKDLCMVPNRFAIAMQDDGWWVRSEIVWHKPNPMPESVTDRPSTAHEKVWLFTKSARYFYDAEAVRRPPAPSSAARWQQDIEGQAGSDRAHAGAKTNGPMRAVGGPRKSDKQRGHSRRHAGFNDRWDAMPKAEQRANGANLRNVWTVPTKGYSEAHFATFPPALIEPCIKAGTSEKGCCPACGAPWVRSLAETPAYAKQRAALAATRNDKGEDWMAGRGNRAFSTQSGVRAERATTGWSPGCNCGKEPVPCVVLDPFGGSGTTGLVADRLGRDAVLIELNPDYAEMAKRRIEADGTLFGNVEVAA